MDMDSLNSLDARSKFFYEYTAFLQRIKDSYTKGDEETVGTFWNSSTGIKIPSNVVGYKNEKVVEIALQNRVIGNQKPIGGLWAKTNNITAFAATIDWDRLQTDIELTHDLMTVTNDVWGRDRQKKFLKEKILDKCRKYNQIEFELTEKILGPFEEDMASSSQDVGILRQSKGNLETQIEFCRTIKALEEENFLALLGDIEVDFNAGFIHGPKYLLYGDDRYPYRYYPPEHCKIKVRVLAYEKEIEMQPVKIALEMLKNDPDYPERQRRIEDARVERTAKRVLKLVQSNIGSNKTQIKFSSDLYDEKNLILKLFGKEIKIPPDSNQHYLCQVIFLKMEDKLKGLEDLEKAEVGGKIWSWDEIEEVSESRIAPTDKQQAKKEPWRPFYNAAQAVNDLIAEETTIKDFFLTKPINTIRINPKYL